MRLKTLLFSAAMLLLLPATMVLGQHAHSDVIFGYEPDTSNPTGIEIEAAVETGEGFGLFEVEFDEPVTGDFNTDDPGFNTEVGELEFNSGDKLWLCAVDARSHSTHGVGYVNYFNPATGGLDVTSGSDLVISDDDLAMPPERQNSQDQTLSGTSFTGSALQFIDTADGSGHIHRHLFFDLVEDAGGNAEVGAYGVMFQIHSDRNTGGGPDGTMDVVSDPFWIVFNHGMDDEDFENALSAFGVPEPGSLTFLLLGGIGLLSRRRRA